MENVITLGKLIGLLFLFCLPLLSILFLPARSSEQGNVMGSVRIYIYTMVAAVTAMV